MFKQLVLISLFSLVITACAKNVNEEFMNINQWRPKVKITEGPSSKSNAVRALVVNRKSLYEVFKFKTPINLSKEMALSFFCKYEAEKDIPLQFRYINLTDKAGKKLNLNLRGRKVIFQDWAYYVFYLNSSIKIDADFDYKAVKSITFYTSHNKKIIDYNLFLSLSPFCLVENLPKSRKNLVFNGDFKQGTPGMSLIPGWSTSFWTKIKGKVTLEPDRTIKWDNPAGAKGQIYSRNISVKPGKQYQLKLIVKTGDTKKISCLIRWQNADYKPLKDKSGKKLIKRFRLKVSPDSKFMETAAMFKVPANARFATLYFINTQKSVICYKNIMVSSILEKIDEVKK